MRTVGCDHAGRLAGLPTIRSATNRLRSDAHRTRDGFTVVNIQRSFRLAADALPTEIEPAMQQHSKGGPPVAAS